MKEYTYKVKGDKYVVNINEIEGNIAKVEVNGIPFEVEVDRPINTVSKPIKVEKTVAAKKETQQAPTPAAPSQPSPTPQTGGKEIKAPLPGVIQDIVVKVGDSVKKGDTVIVLEAMKMANNISAECDGTITSINVNKGDSVMEGHTLLTIA